MWSNDLARSFDEWGVNKPEFRGLTETQYFFRKFTGNFKTGPQSTDFNGKKSKNKPISIKFEHKLLFYVCQDQRYVYMNSLRKTTQNANGILTSPKIKVAVPTKVCIK